MLYIRLGSAPAQPGLPGQSVDGEPEGAIGLLYYCKNCGHTLRGEDAGADTCIMETDYTDDAITYKQFLTPNIEHDPTLPRKSDIVCPNEACTRPTDAPNEVIYAKWDDRNLKYMYYCCHCKMFWKAGGGVEGRPM